MNRFPLANFREDASSHRNNDVANEGSMIGEWKVDCRVGFGSNVAVSSDLAEIVARQSRWDSATIRRSAHRMFS